MTRRKSPDRAVGHEKIVVSERGRPAGKLGRVLAAVETEPEAMVPELVTLTGWLPHTTRAAITRLRQRGFALQLTEQGGRKAYRVDVPA